MSDKKKKKQQGSKPTTGGTGPRNPHPSNH